MSLPTDRTRAAVRAIHAREMDIDGMPVMDHLERVCDQFPNDLDTQIVALLHHAAEHGRGEYWISDNASPRQHVALMALGTFWMENPLTAAYRILGAGSGHAVAVARACARDRLDYAPEEYRTKYTLLLAHLAAGGRR